MVLEVTERPQRAAIQYFLRRYRFLFGAVLVLTVASSVLESVGLVAFFPVFSSLLSDSQEDMTGILGVISNAAERLPFANPLVSASVLLIGIFLLRTLSALMRDVMIGYTGAKVLYDVKSQVMQRLGRAHYQYFLDNSHGSLLYKSLSAPGHVSAVLLAGTGMATSILKIIFTAMILALILPWVAFAIAGVGILYYAGIHYLSRKVSFRLGAEKAVVGNDETVIVSDFLSGFRQNIALNVSKWWTNRFDEQNRRFSELTFKETAWLAVPKPVMEFSTVLLMVSFILALWLGNTDTNTESLAVAGVFGVALVQLMPSLTSLGSMRMGFMTALPNLQIAYDSIAGPIPERISGDRDLESFEHSIAFANVSYAHKERELLFQNIDLTFEKGTVTAIVGASGAGKTTIINLILGLFEPTEGMVTVDGVPIQELKQEVWLNRIGFVSQDPFTYNASIIDNILFGRNGRSVESVFEVAKLANAHEFISELPEGYNTIVGERGLKLSGGQQQRIAIARALLNEPEILIFDEATSSLDSISEKLVQDAINKVSIKRTVIIIAHRLTTVSHADKIIVLDGGRVIEEGRHQDLLENRGQYYRLATRAT